MADVVVTVSEFLWQEWMEEGDLPGEGWSGCESRFWIARGPLPVIDAGERVYIVAHGKVRGYAPLVALKRSCRMVGSMGCLIRRGGAVAVTIPEPIPGFRGWRYRWWGRSIEVPFPDWRQP